MVDLTPTVPRPPSNAPLALQSTPTVRTLKPAPIRIATAADRAFVDHLQRKFARCVGFLPRPAIEWYLDQQYVTLAQENDEPAGYLLGRKLLHWQPLLRPITQACVAMDAQRRHHGLALLATVEAEARAAGQIGIQACCATGLEANDFWRAAGFKPIVHMTPSNVRGREIICWRKPLVSRVPLWFALPPRRAGYRARIPNSTRDLTRRKDHHEHALRYI